MDSKLLGLQCGIYSANMFLRQSIKFKYMLLQLCYIRFPSFVYWCCILYRVYFPRNMNQTMGVLYHRWSKMWYLSLTDMVLLLRGINVYEKGGNITSFKCLLWHWFKNAPTLMNSCIKCYVPFKLAQWYTQRLFRVCDPPPGLGRKWVGHCPKHNLWTFIYSWTTIGARERAWGGAMKGRFVKYVTWFLFLKVDLCFSHIFALPFYWKWSTHMPWA